MIGAELCRTDGQVETLRNVSEYRADVTKGVYVFIQPEGIQLRNMETALFLAVRKASPHDPVGKDPFESEALLLADDGKKLTVRDKEGFEYRWDEAMGIVRLTTRTREIVYNLHRLESFFILA
jgi:hypothetical protein